MNYKSRSQRLHSLCSHAQSEGDPRQLESLLVEIEGILTEVIEEIGESLQEVETVLKQKCQLRIH
jgi:hypothetical protein